MAQVVQTLDDYGRPAWIAAMVVGFVLFWPIGLTILAYMLWSGRMSVDGTEAALVGKVVDGTEAALGGKPVSRINSTGRALASKTK